MRERTRSPPALAAWEYIRDGRSFPFHLSLTGGLAHRANHKAPRGVPRGVLGAQKITGVPYDHARCGAIATSAPEESWSRRQEPVGSAARRFPPLQTRVRFAASRSNAAWRLRQARVQFR